MDHKKLKVNSFENYMDSHRSIDKRRFLIDDLSCLINDPFIPVRKIKPNDTRKATNFFIKRAGILDDDN